MAGQALGTVTNDPRAHEPKSWFGWGRSDLSRAGPPPALDPNKYPNIKRKDLEPYLRVIRGAHQHFLQDRESLAEANNRQALLDGFEPGSVPGQTVACHQGDGLAKALQRVPAQFFQEDFSVEASGLLHGAESPAELGERIDALSGYLDVVESELMREVAVRSSRVFQAAGDVSIVHQQLCGALGGVRGLRHHLHTVDASTYACACNVVALQSRRGALAAALDTLQGLEEVALSRSALQLLLDSQDYAAALDLLEVVVLNVEASTSMGLQAFAQALPQLRETRELLLSLLACEFVSLAHFSQASQVMDAAIAQAVAGATGAGTPGAQGLLMPGQAQGPLQQQQQQQQAGGLLEARGWGSSEEAAAEREVLHDKLLPIVLALLRVDKLSGALQQLRDNSSAATKAVMQEVLQRMLLGPLGLPHLQAQIQPPPLAAPPFHPPGPLPSIRRVQGGGAGTSHQRHASMGALGGMGGGGGPPLPNPLPNRGSYPHDMQQQGGQHEQHQGGHSGGGGLAFVNGFREEGGGELTGSGRLGGGEGGEGGEGLAGGLDDRGALSAVQGLRHDGFLQVLSVLSVVVEACLAHHAQLAAILKDDILPAAQVAGSTRAALGRSAQAVVQAVADVAAARWSKLLHSRSGGTPRLKLHEFQALADACEGFARLLEPHSGPAAGVVRSSLQQQCRAFLEALHSRNVAQLQQLLEVEQWTATEVAPTFQAIVARLVAAVTPGMGPTPHSSTRAGGHTSSLADTPSSSRRSTSELLAQGRDSSQGPGAAAAQSSGGVGGVGGAAPGPGGGVLLHGKRFTVVNTTLMLLKLLDEYLTLAATSPLYGVEIGHHVCDLIKVFNTQACQLVLGAGAVRTAGLKSISAKHLALSCESCYLVACLVPSLHAAFMYMGSSRAPAGSAGMEPRRHMLLLEFDKITQDLTLHTNEIHSKLVDIMQDRLVAAARQLSQEATAWGAPLRPPAGSAPPHTPEAAAGPLGHGALGWGKAGAAVAAGAVNGHVGPGHGQKSGGEQQQQVGEASAAMRSLAKQLGTLQAVLVPILQQEEVHYIFGRVASLYSEALAATLDSLQPRTESPAAGKAWEESRRLNTLFALQCLQDLPLEPSQAPAYISRLSTFYTKHYGHLGPPPASQPPQPSATAAAAAAAPAAAAPTPLPTDTQAPSLPAPSAVAAPREDPLAAQEAAGAAAVAAGRQAGGAAAAGGSAPTSLADQHTATRRASLDLLPLAAPTVPGSAHVVSSPASEGPQPLQPPQPPQSHQLQQDSSPPATSLHPGHSHATPDEKFACHTPHTNGLVGHTDETTSHASHSLQVQQPGQQGATHLLQQASPRHQQQQGPHDSGLEQQQQQQQQGEGTHPLPLAPDQGHVVKGTTLAGPGTPPATLPPPPPQQQQCLESNPHLPVQTLDSSGAGQQGGLAAAGSGPALQATPQEHTEPATPSPLTTATLPGEGPGTPQGTDSLLTRPVSHLHAGTSRHPLPPPLQQQGVEARAQVEPPPLTLLSSLPSGSTSPLQQQPQSQARQQAGEGQAGDSDSAVPGMHGQQGIESRGHGGRTAGQQQPAAPPVDAGLGPLVAEPMAGSLRLHEGEGKRMGGDGGRDEEDAGGEGVGQGLQQEEGANGGRGGSWVGPECWAPCPDDRNGAAGEREARGAVLAEYAELVPPGFSRLSQGPTPGDEWQQTALPQQQQQQQQQQGTNEQQEQQHQAQQQHGELDQGQEQQQQEQQQGNTDVSDMEVIDLAGGSQEDSAGQPYYLSVADHPLG